MKTRWETNPDKKTKSLQWTFVAIFCGLSGGILYAMWDRGVQDSRLIIGILVAVVLIVMGVSLIKRGSDRIKIRRVEIDYDSGVIRFENFAFVTKFFRNPVQELVTVSFVDMFSAKHWRYKGNDFLRIETGSGIVTVSDVEEIPSLAATTQLIIAENEQSSGFRERRRIAEKPTTPWYAWLIIGAFVLAFLFILKISLLDG